MEGGKKRMAKRVKITLVAINALPKSMFWLMRQSGMTWETVEAAIASSVVSVSQMKHALHFVHLHIS